MFSQNRHYWTLPKWFGSSAVTLQALVYDILPSTIAVFSYVIGSRKLSANEQFFVGAQTAVSLLQTTHYYYWSLSYSAILRSRADSLRSHVILHEWIAFYSAFLNIHWSGVLTALAWLVPQESAARESQSRRVLCTLYNHAPCHFMQSHIRKVYACLAVTCHLRFWQNDRGLLRATAVTRGWNGYRNKSQHRKLTLEKKILPPLQQGFEPVTFRSRVRTFVL